MMIGLDYRKSHSENRTVAAEFFGFVQHRFPQPGFVLGYLSPDGLVTGSQYLGGQDARILCTIQGHGGHGYPSGHLQDAQDGIPSVYAVPAFDRYADDRQWGDRSRHARQVRRPSGSGNYYPYSALFSGFGVFVHAVGCAVRRYDVDGVLHP